MKNVWSFDLGMRTGVAMGAPPSDFRRLNSHAVDLSDGVSREDGVVNKIAVSTRNLESYLWTAIKMGLPDFVVLEAPMLPAASQNMPRTAMSLLNGPALAIELVKFFKKRNVETCLVQPATVRSVFMRRANAGNRTNTKLTVLEYGKLWGYLPQECRDDNRADAVAGWHWAQVTKFRWQPPAEVLFGQRVPVLLEGADLAKQVFGESSPA